MLTRFTPWLACAVLAASFAGCSIFRRSGSERPSASQIAESLPKGATVDEIAYADLTGDGRDEVLVGATVRVQDAGQPTAFVFTTSSRGRHHQVFRRPVLGQGWLPIQVGRIGDAPLAAVFASREGSRGNLGYLVVQQKNGVVQVTLERSGLLSGQVRFVPEGLLESQGDVDRLYVWWESRLLLKELPNQYEPPLPPQTITVAYTVDTVRGPMTDSPRVIRARAGQHLFLRRFGTGDPSRILFAGATSSYAVRPDGVIKLLQPDQIEIHIEGPAYSGRTFILLVRIEP